ncbi:MAG: hypothetical protein F4X98_04785 [Gammaproteobacteria bacterium]|nr:hypothetical protein [Gammaproteobacteria bacterium]
MVDDAGVTARAITSATLDVDTDSTEHSIPLFLSASRADRESFVRVINRSAVDGRVEIRAIDDSGWAPPAVALDLGAEQTVHFNSGDLENSNSSKGLEDGIRSPMQGDWRLVLTSDLDIEALAYVRTKDGMLTSMVDTVAAGDDGLWVPTFNPGKNQRQVSVLRVVNLGAEDSSVVVRGVDDSGASASEPVSFTLPASQARSFTAPQLEEGRHDDLEVHGALGAGTGKWRLTVEADGPIVAMSLLDSPTRHLTNLSTVPRAPVGGARVHRVNYMPPATSWPAREGFVRVINRSAVPGEVRIISFDDSGGPSGPATLTVAANGASHFNSRDLQDGNADKGLSAGIRTGMSDLRLELTSDLDIVVLAYIRTRDGFVTSMHDVVPHAGYRHRVSTFNPGSNPNQVSRLRVINPGSEPVEVSITGIDDKGRVPGADEELLVPNAVADAVRLTVPADGAVAVSATELESGSTERPEGALGDGDGKWQLIVAAERAVHVVNQMESPTGHLTNLSTRPPSRDEPPIDPYFEALNDRESRSWWPESAPYSCTPVDNPASPWVAAGMPDLGGSDPLSLIRFHGDGTVLRYGNEGFYGCTRSWKYPDAFRLDNPADPTYYTASGDIEIFVDVARVPTDAVGWIGDDGERVALTMDEAVRTLNEHVAPFYRRLSEGKFRITFSPGADFEVGDDGSPDAMHRQQKELTGWTCGDDLPCQLYAWGAMNRLLFTDVANDTGGRAWNGWAAMGLVHIVDARMETIIHEIGHAWLLWPHSFAEVLWRPDDDLEIEFPNEYNNYYDFMSRTGEAEGWRQTYPTLAINRYSAGWIEPERVALHLADEGTYTLSRAFDPGHQFLVVHSGRRYAFTTLEVHPDRDMQSVRLDVSIHDPSVEGGKRTRNYEGVQVNRYDQTYGTGARVRVGPAFYDRENPNWLRDVGYARDDYSMITDGQSRDLGGGVTASVSRNPDGSFDVTISGGRVAEFEPWCARFSFVPAYETGCRLDYPR